jgi:aspartate kinase
MKNSLETRGDAVRTATLKTGVSRLTLHGVPHQAGIAAKLFKEIGNQNINVDDIIQSVSSRGKNVTVSFIVAAEQTDKARAVSQKIGRTLGGAKVEVTRKLARLRVVGMGMRSHSGVAARLFEAIAAEGINIENISTGEIVISVLVPEKHAQRALAAVRSTFGLEQEGD